MSDYILWLILVLIVCVVIAQVMYLYKIRKVKPNCCKHISSGKVKKEVGTGDSSPDWLISWTAPTQGTGMGYTVTYGGSVIDSNEKVIYTFDKISVTNFTLPGTTYPGDYNVTVIATNQVGAGEPYTQKITLADHIPIITGLKWSYNYYLGQMSGLTCVFEGSFPDCNLPDCNGTTHPSNYSFSAQVIDEKGNDIVSFTNWYFQRTNSSISVAAEVSFGTVLNPGDTITTTLGICNYNLCASTGDVKYTVVSSKPSQSSNIQAKFNVSN